MRRSAAPSQLSGNAAKRTKFMPPFLKSTPQTSSPNSGSTSTKRSTALARVSSTETTPSSDTCPIGGDDHRPKKSESPHLVESASVVPLETRSMVAPSGCAVKCEAENSEGKTGTRSKLRIPRAGVAVGEAEKRGLKCNKDKQICADGEVEKHYYNVMWAKRTKKKHKKWEGDAILITKARSVKLLDMEGKEIGQSTGYKLSDLKDLQEGQTLIIGGKEIEIMNSISDEEWSTGKCFSPGLNEQPDEPKRKPPATKPFRNPLQASTSQQVQTPKLTRVTPKFDPTAPGALVMPRPNATHQWQFNQHSLPVVDVVVDPHVRVHLRPHQRSGVLFLYECIMGMKPSSGQGAILADEMGLGKTLQCIALVWTLLKQGPYGGKAVVRRILIVTPSSLVKNWCQEFRKWLGKERILVYAVGPDKPAKDFGQSTVYPVMIISYEMLMRSMEAIDQVRFDIMICDEGHRLKNSTIKTTSVINNLNIKRRIVLTGTPIQNDLQEFFSIVEFCNPGILGSRTAFKRVYEDPIVRSRQPEASAEERELGDTRAAEMTRLISSFTLRRTQEINSSYLPPKVESVVFCKASQLQLQVYNQLLSSSVIRSCLSTYYSGTTHLLCLSALKKLCNHPGFVFRHAQSLEDRSVDGEGELQNALFRDVLSIYPPGFDPNELNTDDSGKLTVLSEMLKSFHESTPKQRVVVVSNYTQTLDVLQKMCEMEGYTYCRLDGSTASANRQDIVNRFNDKHSDQFVFLLSCKAGGVGLNLIGAARLILYDIDWNPANDLQAMARVWWDGQRRTVYIYRLLTTGTIEEKIYQRQISKQGLSGAVVDFLKDTDAQFSPADLKDLFSLHEDTACLTHDLLECQCCQDNRCVQSLATAKEGSFHRKSNLKPKSASMAELTRWQHHSSPFSDALQDGHLLDVATKTRAVTFVFKTNTNADDSSHGRNDHQVVEPSEFLEISNS